MKFRKFFWCNKSKIFSRSLVETSAVRSATCSGWPRWPASSSASPPSSSPCCSSTSWRRACLSSLQGRFVLVSSSSSSPSPSELLVLHSCSASWAGGPPSSSSSCSSPRSSPRYALETTFSEQQCTESGPFLFLLVTLETLLNLWTTKLLKLKVSFLEQNRFTFHWPCKVHFNNKNKSQQWQWSIRDESQNYALQTVDPTLMSMSRMYQHLLLMINNLPEDLAHLTSSPLIVSPVSSSSIQGKQKRSRLK